MRAIFRQFQDAVTRAIQSLEDYAVSLAGRVDALENRAPVETQTQTIVEKIIEVRTVEGQSVDLSGIDAQIEAAISKAVAELPAPTPTEPPQIDYAALQASVTAWLGSQSENLKGRDAEPVNYDAIVAALEEWLRVNLSQFIPAPIAPPEIDYERIVAEVTAQIPPPAEIVIPEPIPGKDGISVSKVEIVGTDLLVTYSTGKVENIGRVVGKDGVTTVETIIRPGIDGNDGMGIADITQDGNELIIVLSKGEPKRFKLPEARQLRTFGPGSGVSEARVLELIAQNGSGATPNTGWAQYLDTQYTQVAPFEILDGITANLPNNAGNNITAYLPEGETLYDPALQKFTPAAIGDYNAITIRFTAEASSTSTFLEFGIDTGNPAGPIFRDIKVFPKGAGVEHPFTFTCLGFSLNNFTNNGGIVKITPVGGDVEVYDINYHFARLIPA